MKLNGACRKADRLAKLNPRCKIYIHKLENGKFDAGLFTDKNAKGKLFYVLQPKERGNYETI